MWKSPIYTHIQRNVRGHTRESMGALSRIEASLPQLETGLVKYDLVAAIHKIEGQLEGIRKLNASSEFLFCNGKEHHEMADLREVHLSKALIGTEKSPNGMPRKASKGSEEIQAREGSDLRVPLPELSSAIPLCLAYMEGLILHQPKAKDHGHSGLAGDNDSRFDYLLALPGLMVVAKMLLHQLMRTSRLICSGL